MQLHIGYLRSLEDSERVRAACLNYLQNWLVYFCADRPDIVAQVQLLAATLGGHLETPELPRKYAPIQSVFGRTAAYRLWSYAPMMKQSFVRSWDRTLYRLESRDRELVGQRGSAPEGTGIGWAKVPARSMKLGGLLASVVKAGAHFWM